MNEFAATDEKDLRTLVKYEPTKINKQHEKTNFFTNCASIVCICNDDNLKRSINDSRNC